MKCINSVLMKNNRSRETIVGAAIKSSMQINGDNLDVIVWFVCFGICLSVTDLLAYFHAFYNASKYRVFVIQPWLLMRETEKKQTGSIHSHHDYNCRANLSF